MIPFNTGMRVTGPRFCGRQQELENLRDSMKSAGRVYLVGERRIGKTSLIFESVRALKGYRVIYVDLMAVKTTGDVVQHLAAALVKSEKKQTSVLKLLKELAHLQPTMSIDPITNAPTISFSPGTRFTPETLDGVFSLIGTGEKTVVIFDEFQDIQKVPSEDSLLARLRGMIQHQEFTSFVFCGSVRSSMEDIFTNHDSPFFNMAMRLQLGPLDRDIFIKFLAVKFMEGGRVPGDALLDKIIDLCGDNPGAVQRFCTALWLATSTGQIIVEEDLVKAWERLFAMQAEQYGIILQGLSNQQYQALRALARFGGKSKVTGEFVLMTGISLQASLVKALKGLVDKRVVVKEKTVYKIGDPFLTGWLTSQRL